MPAPEAPLPERAIDSRHLYRGRILNLRLDTVELPRGGTAQREIVEHGDVAAIVPIDHLGNVVLVRQFRLAVGSDLLEVPAGGIDPGETPEEAAQRELAEETGLRARQLRRLGGFYVSPGYTSEFIHVFLAQGLEPTSVTADPDEDIVVERVQLSRSLELIREGAIRDAKSIVGLLWAARELGLLVEAKRGGH
ncbi:MAG: NUDIX hydrolase [Dehalococcoidia bacterium]|nr:NUDIX hydrolase [Dehalococcoidia bacterium]MDW8008088.1 NUDIX hydrolase [Chloroflexota bacterium]